MSEIIIQIRLDLQDIDYKRHIMLEIWKYCLAYGKLYDFYLKCCLDTDQIFKNYMLYVYHDTNITVQKVFSKFEHLPYAGVTYSDTLQNIISAIVNKYQVNNYIALSMIDRNLYDKMKSEIEYFNKDQIDHWYERFVMFYEKIRPLANI